MEIGIIHQGKVYVLTEIAKDEIRGVDTQYSFSIEDSNLKISDLELLASIGVREKTSFYEQSISSFSSFHHASKEEIWYLQSSKKHPNKFVGIGIDDILKAGQATQADYACFLSVNETLDNFATRRDHNDQVHYYKLRIYPLGYK